MAFFCSFVLMISTWPSKGHALSSPGSKRSLTSIRTLERRSSRSEIRMDTMSRSVRCLRRLAAPDLRTDDLVVRSLFQCVEISDHVCSLLGIGKARKWHEISGNNSLRVGDEIVKRLVVPGDVGGFHRPAEPETGYFACLAAHDPLFFSRASQPSSVPYSTMVVETEAVRCLMSREKSLYMTRHDNGSRAPLMIERE
jgi:hypothetical protein